MSEMSRDNTTKSVSRVFDKFLDVEKDKERTEMKCSSCPQPNCDKRKSGGGCTVEGEDNE